MQSHVKEIQLESHEHTHTCSATRPRSSHTASAASRGTAAHRASSSSREAGEKSAASRTCACMWGMRKGRAAGGALSVLLGLCATPHCMQTQITRRNVRKHSRAPACEHRNARMNRSQAQERPPGARGRGQWRPGLHGWLLPGTSRAPGASAPPWGCPQGPPAKPPPVGGRVGWWGWHQG